IVAVAVLILCVVSAFEGGAEIAAIEVAIAKPRTIVLRRIIVGAEFAKVAIAIVRAIVSSLLLAFVVTGVQRGLAQLVGATPVRVAIPPIAALSAGARAR